MTAKQLEERKQVLNILFRNKEEIDKRIEAGIEQNRKGYAHLQFEDKNGKPISITKAKVTQIDHDFKYGANIFMLDEFGDDTKKNEIYKKRFAECFNMATLPFYWCDLEPEEGKPRYSKDSKRIYRRPTPDLCLEFCEKNNIMPKAHCLSYMTPSWVPIEISENKKAISKHFKELAERYADRIPCWEVVNETVCYKKERPFWYENDYIEWNFNEAEKYFPHNELVINECYLFANHRRSPYYLLIERALRNGARIDAIGFQCHKFFRREHELSNAERYDPYNIFEQLDEYGEFGKPIQFTEVTIPAYSNDSDDEEIQAKIIERLYEMWFSHPNVESIVYWNLIDGYAAFTEPGNMTEGENYYYGGLLRYDGSPKPSYDVVNKMFNEKYRTRTEIDVADSKGVFNGFFGNYEVEFDFEGKTYKQKFHYTKQIAQRNIVIKAK